MVQIHEPEILINLLKGTRYHLDTPTSKHIHMHFRLFINPNREENEG